MNADVRTDEERAVADLAQPLASAEGLDLIAIDIRGQGGQRLVRVTVDASGGVGLEACQRVSRALSAALDASDPVAGTYRLEVTSPGTDRPLRTRRDFERVVGRSVRITHTADGASREVTGAVVSAAGDAVTIDADGDEVAIRYDDIVTATQALPW